MTEADRIKDHLRACKTVQQLRQVWEGEQKAIAAVHDANAALGMHLVNLKDYLKPQLINDPAMQHPPLEET